MEKGNIMQQLALHDDTETVFHQIDTVIQGDCLEVLRALPDNSMDACVTDPPYGLGEVKDIAGLLQAWIQDADDSAFIGKAGFMGKEWDAGVPSPRYWREVLRVLKPGAHILCFAGTRTVDLMMLSLRLAGFECRDVIAWHHGSGFPKNHDISKAIDRMYKAEREVVRIKRAGIGRHGRIDQEVFHSSAPEQLKQVPVTSPATPEAQHWNGWGTALKPSFEPIILARKPLAEPTIAANVLEWGTGALNIDASRVQGASNPKQWDVPKGGWWKTDSNKQATYIDSTQGRWPSNTLFSHAPGCVPTGMKRVSANRWGKDKPCVSKGDTAIFGNGKPDIETRVYSDSEGYETVESWQCAPDCAIAELDRQSGIRKSGGGIKAINRANNFANGGWKPDNTCYEPSEGGASRYFLCLPPGTDDLIPFYYCSKSSRTERNKGLGQMPAHASSRNGTMHGTPEHAPKQDTPEQNNHPTVKSLSLMKWLVRLVCPENGIILDSFAGSGTTCVAAIHEGFHFIGIEREEEYCAIARARIAYAQQGEGLRNG